jgi:hypothetical protein
MVMEVSAVEENTRSLINVTLAGMAMEVSAVEENESLSIVVRLLPSAKVMEVSEVAPLNAELPMEVTLAGRVIEVSAFAPENESSPIVVTPSGMTTAPAQLPPAVTTPLVIV